MKNLTCLKHIIPKVFGIMMLFLLPWVADAQHKVTGKIIDKKTSTPIEGAAVKVKGGKGGAAADAAGAFSITVPSANSVLEVSSIGYASQEVALKGRSSITIEMEESIKSMDDVVMIGYQNVTRRTTSAAISTVKGKDIENMPYPTFDQMLQGRVAGLNVLNVSGEPGANNIVQIRGNSNVLDPNGISAPLYVIDGIVFDVSDTRTATSQMNPLASINPNDIESIDILKDASASAIYGSRAGNGVIIVKTKKPKAGVPQIRISSYTGISFRPRLKPMIVGAAERRQKMELLQKLGTYAGNQNISLLLTDSLNPAFNNNVDWQGLFMKTALINNVEASIAAASEKFSYRLSFSRYYEDGVMRGYDFQRTAPRLYFSGKPTEKLEISTDLYATFQKAKHGPATNTGSRYPFFIWGFPSSFWQLGEQDLENYKGRNENLRDDDRNIGLSGNTRLIYKFNPNLVFTSSISYNFGMNRRDLLLPGTITGNNRNDAINYVSSNRRWENENFLTYNRTIKENHNASILLGQGAEENVNNITNARGNGVAMEAIKVIQGVPAGSGLTASTNFEERSRLYYFTRLHYDYQGKYGLDLSLRREASSRFSADNRWGNFSSVSALWVVSDEKFFDPFSKYISFLKLRASYGLTGRDPLSYYGRYINLTNNAGYSGGSLGAAGGSILSYNGTSIAYPNYSGTASAPTIGWERYPQSNIGFDMNLFNDRISLTGDYYVRNSESMVFNVNVPYTTGFTTAQNNYVSVRNTGVELTLTAQVLPRRSAFKWTSTLNVAFNDNYITKLPQNNRDFSFGPPWLRRTLTVGMPSFSFLVWDVPNIYPSTDAVPVDPLTGQRMKVDWGNFFAGGDPARVDMNGDYVINDFDRILLGNPNTKVQGGFINNLRYKSFGLSVQSVFIVGRKLWNGYVSDKMQDAGTGNPYLVWGPFSGPSSDFRGAFFWTQNGDNAEYPGLVVNNVDKWHIAQSFYVENASFFRVKNIMVDYSLPEKLMRRLRLKGVRVYSSIDNVWVYSKATVPDPEPVQPDGYSSGNDYPLPRKLTLGLEVNF